MRRLHGIRPGRTLAGTAGALLLATAAACGGACPGGPAAPGWAPEAERRIVAAPRAPLPVAYELRVGSTTRRHFPVAVDPAELAAGELPPLGSRSIATFHYRLALAGQLAGLPLSLTYRDGAGTSPAGEGWRLVLALNLPPRVEIDLLAPELLRLEAAGSTLIGLADVELPVREEGEGGAWVHEASDRRLRFTDLDGERVLLAEARLPGLPPFAVGYREGGLPAAILSGGGMVELAYREEAARRPALERLLFRAGGAGGVEAEEWRLGFEAGAAGRFLTEILRRRGTGDLPGLRFSYGALEAGAAAEPAGEAQGSLWRIGSRPLPAGLTIADRPAVEFLDLDLDGYPDVIESGPVHRRAWRWEPRTGTWRSADVFRPPRPFFRSFRVPTGSQFMSLAKVFGENDPRNTFDFPSVLTGFYSADPDGGGLRYVAGVCFPRVCHGEPDPDEEGNLWECSEDPRLALPVPLQLESSVWPRGVPDLRTMEGFKNQATQVVHFTRGGELNLFYLGQRYRDAASGEVLLAPHRDTGNCRERHVESWGRRRVRVETCQAVWKAAETFWQDSHAGPFWQRLDLTDGVPNGRFTLPWHDDPGYHYHYEAFRHLAFARLDGPDWFALVRDPTGCPAGICPPEQVRPAARDVYRLRGTRWQKLAFDSELRPPEAYFDSQGLLADLDGDGLDDLVLPRSGEVFVNRGEAAPRWLPSAAHRLPDRPRTCNLLDGSCRLVDLDRDGDLDLFLADGRTVYLNGTHDAGGPRRRAMTAFTDKDGRLKPVPRPGGGRELAAERGGCRRQGKNPSSSGRSGAGGAAPRPTVPRAGPGARDRSGRSGQRGGCAPGRCPRAQAGCRRRGRSSRPAAGGADRPSGRD
jgi:hypothetical protein